MTYWKDCKMAKELRIPNVIGNDKKIRSYTRKTADIPVLDHRTDGKDIIFLLTDTDMERLGADFEKENLPWIREKPRPRHSFDFLKRFIARQQDLQVMTSMEAKELRLLLEDEFDHVTTIDGITSMLWQDIEGYFRRFDEILLENI